MKDRWLRMLFIGLVAGVYENKACCVTHREIFTNEHTGYRRDEQHTDMSCVTFSLRPYSRSPEAAYTLCQILNDEE